jgi:hypothetical protein
LAGHHAGHEINWRIEMDTKIEGTLALIAALIVLFSAMWNPLVSVGISIIALLGLGIFNLIHKSS